MTPRNDTMSRPAAGARLAGNFAPVAVECDADHLRVTGRLPRELNGTLYRNGPNPRFPAADAVVDGGVAAPLHPRMSEADADAVTAALRRHAGGAR